MGVKCRGNPSTERDVGKVTSVSGSNISSIIRSHILGHASLSSGEGSLLAQTWELCARKMCITHERRGWLRQIRSSNLSASERSTPGIWLPLCLEPWKHLDCTEWAACGWWVCRWWAMVDNKFFQSTNRSRSFSMVAGSSRKSSLVPTKTTEVDGAWCEISGHHWEDMRGVDCNLWKLDETYLGPDVFVAWRAD